MLGVVPWGTLGVWEGVSSRGLTRVIDCMEFSWEREVIVMELANIVLGQCL